MEEMISGANDDIIVIEMEVLDSKSITPDHALKLMKDMLHDAEVLSESNTHSLKAVLIETVFTFQRIINKLQ